MNELSQLLFNFIDYEKNIKNRSLCHVRYYYHIRSFNNYIISIKWNILSEDIEISDIFSYLNYYKTKKVTTWPNIWKYPSRNALYNNIVSIRMFFKYLTLIWKKLKFSWEQIPIFKMDEVHRELMSKEDYELLKQAIILYNSPDRQDIILRDQLLFEIPRETWLRREEIVRCKFSDFHNQNRQFKIEVKWWRYENVFFSIKLQQKVLQYEKLIRQKYRWYEDIEYLFFYMGQKNKWKKMSWQVAWIIVSNYVKRLKADGKIPKDKKLSLHMERHSFAMKCVYSGLSQQATTQLMRHKDPKITMYYYHMNDERLLNQYDMIK